MLLTKRKKNKWKEEVSKHSWRYGNLMFYYLPAYISVLWLVNKGNKTGLWTNKNNKLIVIHCHPYIGLFVLIFPQDFYIWPILNINHYLSKTSIENWNGKHSFLRFYIFKRNLFWFTSINDALISIWKAAEVLTCWWRTRKARNVNVNQLMQTSGSFLQRLNNPV